MKKLLLFSALIGFAFLGHAQTTTTTTSTSSGTGTYHAFKVDLGFGYAIPSDGTGTKAGVTFAIEPHYRLNDELAVGFRFEGAALGNKTEVDNGTKVKISLLTSYCATGEYYFMDGGFRPFAGAGAGFFTRRIVASNENESISASGNKFGFFPRVGIEAGHFRAAAEYNIIGDKGSYLAFSIGFFLGGGKK